MGEESLLGLKGVSKPCSGIVDPMLQKLAACGNSYDDPHMCRNLHRLIQKTSRSLPVPISKTDVLIRMSRKGRALRTKIVEYPLLRPSDWVRTIFKSGDHFLLGGNSMDSIDTFGDTLQTFWHYYKAIHPTMQFEGSPRMAIPFFLHGDEGRGKGKKPIMVLSLQPLITSPDMSTSNLSGCLCTSVVWGLLDFL